MSKRIRHQQIISFLLLVLCAAMAANTAFAAEAVNLGGDGTESWQYIDDTHDDGRFSYAAELEDGTIGLVFWCLEDGGKSGYKLRFFTADGKPTGKEVIIPKGEYDDIIIQNVTKSRLQMICETLIRETTDTGYRTVHYDNYLIDWDGNEIAQLAPFDVHTGFCSMIEEADGLVMTGYNLEDSEFRTSIRKTDLQGSILWETFLPCAWPDTMYVIPEHFIRTDDGGYIVLQQEPLSTNRGEDAEDWRWEYRNALVKLDKDGNILWTSTEGFENSTDMSMAFAMTDGKIAVSYVSYDGEPESLSISNPRRIAWFDENGKPVGTAELEISLENYAQLQRAMETAENGKDRIAMFYESRMIPMEDGLWMSATITLRETEDDTVSLEMIHSGLFKIPEP